MSKASTGSLTAHLSDFFLIAKGLARRFGGRRNTVTAVRLNDFMLKDIGLSRADIFSLTHKVLPHD